MRPLRPQLPARAMERISPKLKAFADLQIKLVVAAMNRMLVTHLQIISPLPEEKKPILAGVEKLLLTQGQEQSVRRAEEAILQQIMAAKKGKAYLRAIAALRTHTPILDTPITSDVTADQRRRALALQLLHQFLLNEAVPQSQILPIRIENPVDNPFLPSHRVEAFTILLERWASTFDYAPRAEKVLRARLSTAHPPPSNHQIPVPQFRARIAPESKVIPAEVNPPPPDVMPPSAPNVAPPAAAVVATSPAPTTEAVTQSMVAPMEPASPETAVKELPGKTGVNGKVSAQIAASPKKESSRSRKPS